MTVRVENLIRQYTVSGTPAVHGVSFAAPGGSITALLGPSGSGKTTVLRLIAGLERPDSGSVHFDEQDYTHVPVQRRGVGFVFQGYALFRHLTVWQNIAFGLKLQKLPKSELLDRTREYLELVQLEGLEARYPDELSGGQQQRVAFARALATRPRVLLLDEPFGALDRQVRVELRAWLRRLHRKTHVTTFLVTHDQEEALEVAEHIVVMQEGRVVQAGTPQAVYDHPKTAFVAKFIGNANVLEASIEDGKLAIGSERVALDQVPENGSSVRAILRPHEVRIGRAASATDHAARIEAVTRVGGFVKVELRLASTETLTVQMNRTEFEALNLAAEDPVALDFRAARLLAE